jgi:hypothetical protein
MKTFILMKNDEDGTWTAKFRNSELVSELGRDKVHFSDKRVIEGAGIEACCDFLTNNGVDDNEIDFALTEMIKNGHNMAEFGNFGNFIFSTVV